MEILTEIYQFLFVASIIFIVITLGDLAIKMYGRFALKTEARFTMTKVEKLLLWLSLTTILTYLT
jgi:large-conductance mechanosensitive channel